MCSFRQIALNINVNYVCFPMSIKLVIKLVISQPRQYLVLTSIIPSKESHGGERDSPWLGTEKCIPFQVRYKRGTSSLVY